MTTMASQITNLTVVYSIVYSCADQRKHQSSAFVRGIHRWPVDSPHKGPVTRMFPFDDVIMVIGPKNGITVQYWHSATKWKALHEGVMKWKHFPRHWSFVRGIHRSPVNSPYKGQWRGALMFSLIWALNKRLGKKSWSCWFETQSRSLWRHCDGPECRYEWRSYTILFIYLRVYSLHHNVLPTSQSIPLMTNGPLYPITQDSSCHGQHTMPRNPWSFPWPVPHSCDLHECVCVAVAESVRSSSVAVVSGIYYSDHWWLQAYL